MNKERLMTVLIQPHVSEKAANVTEKANQYVFRVRDDASKAEVKLAVELMFEVKVRGVQVVNEPGKARKFGKIAGNNPFNATGLEWQTQSPPTTFNFDVMPTISQPAYAYDTMECQGAPVEGAVALPGTAH